jgi:hypothetical protein
VGAILGIAGRRLLAKADAAFMEKLDWRMNASSVLVSFFQLAVSLSVSVSWQNVVYHPTTSEECVYWL